MIKGTIVGGEALRKRFDKLKDEADEVFKELVDETATYIHAQAINHISQNVQTGAGHLKQDMYLDLTGINSAEVGNRADYAGYVEFGTGRRVIVPAEFNDIASKVKSRSTKSFKEGLQAIRDWCKRLGIDVKAAYPIFMSILRTGVRPRPFMYPAYKMGVRYMNKEAKKTLEELIKKK